VRKKEGHLSSRGAERPVVLHTTKKGVHRRKKGKQPLRQKERRKKVTYAGIYSGIKNREGMSRKKDLKLARRRAGSGLGVSKRSYYLLSKIDGVRGGAEACLRNHKKI